MDRKGLWLSIAALLLAAGFARAQEIDLQHPEELSPYLFGHNLEHTRAAVNGGLSAQMLRNRKFAGKPSRNQGVALGWFGIGSKVLYLTDETTAYTRHIGVPAMHRSNERKVQAVQNLVQGQVAGIGQREIVLEAGQTYQLRTVTKVSAPLQLTVSLTDRAGEKVYASHALSLQPTDEWTVSAFEMTSPVLDEDASVRYTFDAQAELVFGALSMMPADNFHGMRADVVANLKAIGPSLLRWPGGNFAGEYRWKDGLLTANGQVFSLLKAHQGGLRCPVIDNDDYAVTATVRDGILTISLINDSYDEPRSFGFSLKGTLLDSVLLTSDDVRPHSFFKEAPLDVQATRKRVSTTLPPHSVALIRIQLK